MKIFTLCTLFFLVTSLHAQAQENNSDDKISRVEITNIKGPELRSYSQMQKGIMAYKEKNQLAPESELYFILIPKSKNVSVEGLTMRLTSDETSINIPIDASGKFQLPLIELKTEDEYDLILNKPKGQFVIKPWVKSANLADDTKRLGDIRLECQVRWAIEKQDVSIVFSSYVKLLASGNPCTSRNVSVGYHAPKDVYVITLDAPKSKIALKVRPYESYYLPIWDTDLSDDSLIKYEGKPTSPPTQEQ
jgi:hypothetical protein